MKGFLKNSAVLGLLVLSVLGLGCQKATLSVGSVQDRFQERRLPNKDELARVGERSFTLSGYSALKASLSGTDSETLVWIGLASLTLEQNQIPMDEAVSLARFAVGNLKKLKPSASVVTWWGQNGAPITPEAVHTRIQSLMTQLPIQKNSALLQQLI